MYTFALMRRLLPLLTLVLLAGPAAITTPAQNSTARIPTRLAPSKFELTVDSIMRGPGLVGWAPTSLRWSADSRILYFEWRKPGEKDPSTYAVDRGGGDPRKLSDDDVKNIPPPAVWCMATVATW
jgi:hypothetical protein